MINSQLDSMRLTEFQGLQLSLSDHGLDMRIQHLRLVTSDHLSVDISDIQIARVHALVQALLSSGMESVPKSDISIEHLEIVSPEMPSTGAGNNAAPKVVQGDATMSPLSPETEPNNGEESATGFSIGDTLNRLRHLPIQTLRIQHILWPGTLDSELSLRASQTPQRLIRGELLSARCDTCRLELTLQSEEAQVKLASQLYNGSKAAVQLDSTLQATTSSDATTPPVRWALYGRFRFAADQLLPLLEQTGISGGKSADLLAIARSLTGTVDLAVNGDIQDRITGPEDFHDISASIEARDFTLVLPEVFAGLPLATEITSAQPLKLHIRSMVPLSIGSLEGNLKIRADLPSTSKVSKVTPALLTSSFELSMEGNTPQIVFRGQTRLDEASRLWNTQKWQQLHTRIPVTEMRGTSSFTGAFTLPGFDGLFDESTALKIQQFLMEIRLDDEAEFRLTLPENNNPLAGINWEKLQVKIRSGEAVKISSSQLPGKVNLESTGITLAVNEISSSGDRENTSGVQGEIGRFRCEALPQVDCTLQLKATVPKLDIPDTNTIIEDLNLSLAEARITSTGNGSTSVELGELNLAAAQVLSGEISVTKPELFAQQARCRLESDTLSCQSPQLALNLDPVRHGDNQLRGVVFLENLSVTRLFDNRRNLHATSRFRTDNLNIHALKEYKAGIAATGQWQVNNHQISGNSDITAGSTAIQTTWQHNLETAKGQLTLNLPQVEFSPKNTLSRALQGLPIDIVGGSLSAGVSLHWPPSENNILKLAFRDTAIQHNDSYAVGINTQIVLQQKAGSWIMPTSAPVSVNSVDTGVALNNLHFALSLAANGDLTLGNFSAELLEGALTADRLRWNINGEERHSKLQFTGLSIGALAREMEATNFAASGLLDARIPITTDRQGVTVDNGTVQSRPPGGRLRYYGAFSPGMLGSNPQLKLLAGALEDYNYRDISGTMSYPLSGDLKLNLKLTGRSAAIDANRDLIINLNLENNVPSMLRSLQASRDLTDVLERQVQ
ncbi:intermembrane phospholipid transport protein YdbH family protein [Microbulbifer pacificus]|uniref:intermembrane phospholipid transport protein YdbH family protein n=1 Tax=Microbulbifer pacificus TaxID=407164 RepID=UPI00131A3E4B|nr:YdbH domain-containing protein [Microbulbifer pacificus]